MFIGRMMSILSGWFQKLREGLANTSLSDLMLFFSCNMCFICLYLLGPIFRHILTLDFNIRMSTFAPDNRDAMIS